MSQKLRYFLKIFLFFLLLSPFLYTWIESAFEMKVSDLTLVNVHEHISSEKEIPQLLQLMQNFDIEATVLLGSPLSTLQGKPAVFDHYEENNEFILEVSAKHPSQFIAFPTLDVQDAEKLQKLRGYIEKGARGVKLYAGHQSLHKLPLDHESLIPLYRFCEKNALPIMFHVNTGYYLEEFQRVLALHPNLKVICPHFCLSSIDLNRLHQLLESSPNLYIDISFGYIQFLREALNRISENRENYRAFIIHHQDRILFGTDVVLAGERYKSIPWVSDVIQSYRDMLEKEVYTFFASENNPLYGLALKADVLSKIYKSNFEQLMGKQHNL